jgi:RNA polymerase sigma factor (sigma-70 family)
LYKEPKHINEIIEGCKRQDRKAQEQLYSYFFDAMINLCLRYTKCEADAEDILATAFVRVFKSIQQYDAAKASVYSWVHKIVTNCCLAYLKSKYNTIAVAKIEEAEDVYLEPEIITKMSDETIISLIRELPPATQAVFNLYIIDGYGHKEIAALLQISEGTSRWHLNEARQRLKAQILQKENDIL